jgi:hypothetical protein
MEITLDLPEPTCAAPGTPDHQILLEAALAAAVFFRALSYPSSTVFAISPIFDQRLPPAWP